jgi:hypothetical protein
MKSFQKNNTGTSRQPFKPAQMSKIKQKTIKDGFQGSIHMPINRIPYSIL